MYIYCDRPSNSVKALAKTIPAKRARAGETWNIPDILINWGCTELLVSTRGTKVLNPPEAVRKATDKLLFFQAMAPLKLTPRFYTTSAEALNAILDGRAIVCRTVLNGHSGNGIVVSTTKEQLVPARLYVDYIPKQTEWRVHVFQGKVIDIQRKARDRDVPDSAVNWTVRSHQNGFVYTRGDINEYNTDFINSLCANAISSVHHIGLDFGGVDLIATKSGKVYVLEVNTAPGLEGTTLENYVKAFKSL